MTVKTFILHDDAAVHRMVAYLRQHRKAAAERGHPLQCTIAPYHPTVNDAQRREYWGFILKPMSEQAVVGSHHYPADVWATHCKREFLPDECAKGVPKWREMPDGSRELVMGTGDLNEQEMADYLMRCRVFAQQELGVELPIREPG